jgi:hypothetical protein
MTDSLHLGFSHTGIVVDSLDDAMASYGQVMGYHWAPPVNSTFPLMTPKGLLPREIWVTYSREGPHHLELIEIIEPTAYDAIEGGRTPHHIAYAVKDLSTQVARLESLGYAQQLSARDGKGDLDLFSYHLDPNNGLMIELFDAKLEAGIAAWAAGDREWRPPAS